MVITDASGAERPDPVSDPFADLDAYVNLPRVAGLWLSPDGTRLVVGAGTPDHTNTRYSTALWDVDRDGRRPARRLTRSVEGESDAAFTPAGDLLFVSARPGPGSDDDHDKRATLWLLPAAGGDPSLLASPAGGVRGVAVSESGTVVFGSAMLPSATDAESDTELRTQRKDKAITAVLHEQYPVRFWDRTLGPDHTRLLTAALDGPAPIEPRDVTGHVGNALDDESTWDIAPDGATIVTRWSVGEPGGSERRTIVAIDVATGERRTLADDADHDFENPRISPDGTQVAMAVNRRITPKDPGDQWVAVVPVAGGEIRHLTQSWDRWPKELRWAPDGRELLVTADHHGRTPVWRVDVATGDVTRLTLDDGAYVDVRVSPDGERVYALRYAMDSPPRPVRIAMDGTSTIQYLPGPAEALGLTYEVPGRVREVTTTAADGTEVRGWLALPRGASAESPAPLLLQIHGGPVMNASVWSWRWNPWLHVAKGYAVLMPDFALSTGYGVEFIRRGWGQWGGAPYTDLMTITDAAQTRPDIDETRSAALGGSYGGYMANWIAGHTNRFDAIVTHASVWYLDECNKTSDFAYYFNREMPFDIADANSPHRFADAVTTPMLVIHGDKDYRVPVEQAMRLWWDLAARSTSPDGSSPHKFLHFPDENHWILTPNHAKLWYATVHAFLAHHVLGEEWQRPELLG
jgi:dipeptidyl aminopeptidase/acylaminoacyl peptidase